MPFWLLAILMLTGSADGGDRRELRCSVGELRQAPDHMYRPERIATLVDTVPLIVRAIAVAGDSAAGVVTFRSVETLRGGLADSVFQLDGELSDRDDFNTRPVPYQIVRRAGLRGSCFAREYKAGAEHLLFLERRDGRLGVYRWPLGPVNEQLRGDDDPWLGWVRARLDAPPPSR